MTEDPRTEEVLWADGKNLYDVVPALDAVIEIIGRDLVLGEYSMAGSVRPRPTSASEMTG
jgi:hypothetical protein